MEQVEVVVSMERGRERESWERTFRFTGELLATYIYGSEKRSLYAWEDRGYLIHTDSSLGGSRSRSLSHDTDSATRGFTAEEVARKNHDLGEVLGIPSRRSGILGVVTIHRRPDL